MLLIIDTTDKKCEVAIAEPHDIDSIKWLWQKDTGTEVLRNIEKLLKKNNRELKDIKTIAVNQGPGSYTGTRVGITIANTLGWSLKIPVVGYVKKKPADIAGKIYRKIKIGQIPPGRFPTPRY